MRNKRLNFVTGKGGTGKSFLSALLAVKLSSEGQKVLLIDAEDSGSLAEIFEHTNVGYEPIEIYNKIWLSQINTDDALSEYLELNAKIPSWARITPLSKLIDLISNAAPGVKEILVAGKICYEAKQIFEGNSRYDTIIVDSPSSGHIISLLDAPDALSELVNRGAISEQTKWMKDILESKDTGIIITTFSDEIVISETQELIENIEQKTSVAISNIILNKSYMKENLDYQNPQTQDEVIQNLFSYYERLIEQTNKARTMFENYQLLAFPALSIEEPNLRVLIKNFQELEPVRSL